MRWKYYNNLKHILPCLTYATLYVWDFNVSRYWEFASEWCWT